MPDASSLLATPIDRAGGPLYRQAAASLRAAIGSGRVPVGTALPAEAELAAGFGVSLITLRQALRELEAEGLISKSAGRTAVVAASEPRSTRALNSLEDIVASTRDAQLEILTYTPRPSPEAARAFGLGAGTRFPCLHGRMLVAERPVSEISIFFPPAIGRRLQRADFDDVVVFRSVERRLGIRLSGARITVAAELADAALARVLGIAEGAAVLANTMLYRDADGVPVELTIARHRADLYRFSYELRA